MKVGIKQQYRRNFNQFYVHEGKFDRGTYKLIDSAYRIRENVITRISLLPQKRIRKIRLAMQENLLPG